MVYGHLCVTWAMKASRVANNLEDQMSVLFVITRNSSWRRSALRDCHSPTGEFHCGAVTIWAVGGLYSVQYSTGPAHCTLYCRKQTHQELLCPDDSTVSVFTLTRVPSRCSKQASMSAKCSTVVLLAALPASGPSPAYITQIAFSTPRPPPVFFRAQATARNPDRSATGEEKCWEMVEHMEQLEQGGDNPSYDPLTVIRAKQNM